MTWVRRPSDQTVTLLAVLAADPAEWQYGLQLSRETGLKSGSLYPILMRLAERGMLEDRWDTPGLSGRPPRHSYRLTSRGRSYARDARAPGETAPGRPALAG